MKRWTRTRASRSGHGRSSRSRAGAAGRGLLGWRTHGAQIAPACIERRKPSDAEPRDIRHVYRALLRWAAAHVTRARGTTTLELADSLARDGSLAGIEVGPSRVDTTTRANGEQAIAAPDLERAREQLRGVGRHRTAGRASGVRVGAARRPASFITTVQQ